MNTFSLLARIVLVCLWLPGFLPVCQAQNRSYRQFNTQPVRAFTLKQYPDYIKQLEKLERQIPAIAAKGDDT